MKLSRIAGFAAVLAVCALAAACGGGEHSERHAAEKTTPAPAPPTPDTTPIAPLRTPAGLVLKINEPPTATPATTSAATPAATSAATPAATSAATPAVTPAVTPAPAASTDKAG